jgi:hypothetical protein
MLNSLPDSFWDTENINNSDYTLGTWNYAKGAANRTEKMLSQIEK